LTAGVGTRLRPLTDVRAKPAVPVAGVPLVSRILRALRTQGLTHAVLNLHHRPATLTALIGEGREFGLKVRYSWEQPVLGSAGGPRHALPLLDSDPFLLVNGDTLNDVDYQAMWREHRDSGALVTIALIPNPDPAWYNGVLVDDEGWVRGFAKAGQAPRSYHIIGAQIAAHRAFLRVPDGQPAESTWGVYPQLIAEQPRSVRAFICNATFLDVGTTRDYVTAAQQVAAAEGSDPWTAGRGFSLGPGARVERTIAWDDVTVGRGASLVECILADGVTIPAGARYERSAIIRAHGQSPREDERLDGDLLIAPISR
jgi:NDP-sugar pyrophosphorylase family protein